MSILIYTITWKLTLSLFFKHLHKQKQTRQNSPLVEVDLEISVILSLNKQSLSILYFICFIFSFLLSQFYFPFIFPLSLTSRSSPFLWPFSYHPQDFTINFSLIDLLFPLSLLLLPHLVLLVLLYSLKHSCIYLQLRP